MLKNITRILPFFIVTLLSIGGVELFYGVAEHYLRLPEKESAEAQTAVELEKPPANPEKHNNYEVILKRNLFQSYNRQEEVAAPVAENPLEGLEATTLDLVLMGTVIGPDGSDRAIIFNKKKNEQDIFYKGDVVENAAIKEILRGKVILNYQGKDEVLDMSEAADMRPKPSAVAPTPGRRIVPSDLRRRSIAPDENAVDEVTDEFIEEEPVEFEEPAVEEPIVEEPAFEETVFPEPIENGEQAIENAPEPPVDPGRGIEGEDYREGGAPDPNE
jgi:hypothetical protein